MTTIHTILDQIRHAKTSEVDKGARFEELIRQYLLNEPVYKGQFGQVWRWVDWPGRDGKSDTGIDLVAERLDGTGFVAIQCKCYDPDTTIQKSHIDSFLAASGKKGQFFGRMIVSSTPHWSQHAENEIHGQHPPVQRIDLNDLESSVIDWSAYDVQRPKVKLKPKKRLREHQSQALKDVCDGFKTQDRGKLIMACGTGKTFTSLKIAEKLAGKEGYVLFLVPSLSLLSQTLREWTAESAMPLHCYAVCSDTKIGKHDDNEPTTPDDLAIPATTDGKELAQSFAAAKRHDKMIVVFSTYQSINAIHQAQKKGFPEFDLIICDEAHRTTGVTLADEDESQFVRVHDAKFIRGKKRLYMTATPRLYGDESKKKAAEIDAVLCSMDDETLYGPELYRLGFSDAVSKGLLSDYKVIVLAVSERHVSRTIQKQLVGTGGEIPLDDAVKIIGCWNGLSRKFIEEENAGGKHKAKRPEAMKRAVAFTTTIKQSTLFTDRFAQLVKEYIKLQPDDKYTLQCEVQHVDGKLNALLRTKRLEWLKSDDIQKNHCRILSNAKCLSEGVDVPALDAVMFLNPRKSKVDVVQSVGRVMRKAEGKEYGYIILPIGIPADTTPEEALNNHEKYKVVWDVLQALRAHDDRFNVTINQIELNKHRPDKIQIIGIGDDSDEHDPGTAASDAVQTFFDFGDIEEWKNAIYGKIVTKCGEKKYWEQWAKDVADIATEHIKQIKELIDFPAYRESFDAFWSGLKRDLNPDISEDDVIEMLSQHLITRPVFDALFEGFSFTKMNPVSQSLDAMVGTLEKAGFGSDTQSLDKFYESVRQRAYGVDNAAGKQKVVIELYDKFFKTAFPRMAERLGIVYTPVEVVDFILKGVDQALKQEFNSSIGAKDVHVLDPFTGTGTFIVRLLQGGLIAPKDLKRKYIEELHANEIVLLAYYIAAINIEEAYHEIVRETTGDRSLYLPFEGIVLTDTFLMTEEDGTFEQTQHLDNRSRAKRQRKTPIRVIIGNPPYSTGQRSQNDNNRNTAYPHLDERIQITYATASNAALQRNLYDSYIRAFRWASDRIGNKGVVCYVSNGSYIDGNAMDGFRKCLAEDFTDIYCFNLRGNARTSGEERRKEKGNVFGEGTRTPVAITLMLKNPAKKGSPCTIHYRDIGDYLDREEKLKIVADAGGLTGVLWQIITPNEKYDWINQRDGTFSLLLPLTKDENDDPDYFFGSYSPGVVTSRDSWCYNFSKKELATKISAMISFFNEQVKMCQWELSKQNNKGINFERLIDTDPKSISWSANLKRYAERARNLVFTKTSILQSLYRPFCKQYLYYDQSCNERPGKFFGYFPTSNADNLLLCLMAPGEKKDFSALLTNIVPDYHLNASTQCFPFYTYEKVEDKSKSKNLFAEDEGERFGDYVRRENISDSMLQKFRERYASQKGSKIGKEDIFYYVYGVLHSRSYRERFAADLKKQLPRIPFVEDFWTFSQAGRKLGDLHVHYETGKMFPLKEIPTGSKPNFKVEQMRFPSKTDKSRIIYNASLTLDGIPETAYRYVVNGKSALEWIVERYAVTTHKDNGIVNDPNDLCKEHGNERYIVDLIKRVVHLSVESVKIIDGLPELTW